MKQNKQRGDLVVVSRQPTLWLADIDAATLRGAGIEAIVVGERSATMLPHMALGLNPRGIPVLVKAEDAGAAREALQAAQPLDEAPQDAAAPEVNPASERPEAPAAGPAAAESPETGRCKAADYAHRAFRASVMMYICLPLVALALWYLVRAILSACGQIGHLAYVGVTLLVMGVALVLMRTRINEPVSTAIGVGALIAGAIPVVLAVAAQKGAGWRILGALFFLGLLWLLFEGAIFAAAASQSYRL